MSQKKCLNTVESYSKCIVNSPCHHVCECPDVLFVSVHLNIRYVKYLLRQIGLLFCAFLPTEVRSSDFVVLNNYQGKMSISNATPLQANTLLNRLALQRGVYDYKSILKWFPFKN
ncbi:hypothetical protein PBPRB0198 [Photobacterium profundum SS9]|uniref:Uncharacterized protein n=1 Tax=Photobacterium profundum (strain SS9) TaxID=298386 RepID=Q6LKN7_PHOPR|nr:hypothetical protein PBPRB0198 [Photobacterium profundum SS9]